MKSLFRSALLKNALSGGASKYIQVAVGLVTTPLLLQHWGPIGYGSFIVINTIAAYVLSADLGLGGALVALEGRFEESEKRREFHRTCLLISVFVSAAILCLVGLFHTFAQYSTVWVNWESLSDQKGALCIALLSAAISLPLIVAQKIYLANGRDYLNQIASVCIVLLCAVINIAIVARGGSVATVVIANSIVVPLCLASQTFWIWRTTFLLGMNRKMRVSGELARQACGAAAPLWIVQILALLGGQLDVLLLGLSGRSEQIAQYYIYQRLFSLAQLGQFFVVPLWPIFGKMLREHSSGHAFRSLKRYALYMAALSAVCGLAVVAVLPLILDWWLGKSIDLDLSLGFVFVLFGVAANLGGVASMYMSNEGLLWRNVRLYGFATAAALLIKYLLVGSYDAAGLLTGSLLGYLVFYTVPVYFIAKYHEKK